VRAPSPGGASAGSETCETAPSRSGHHRKPPWVGGRYPAIQAPDLNLHYPSDPKTPPDSAVWAAWFKQLRTLPAVANASARDVNQFRRSSAGTQVVEGARGHEGTRRDSSRRRFQTGEVCMRCEGVRFLGTH
jgi:hypothetical protein